MTMEAFSYLTLALLTGLCVCQNILDRGPAIGTMGGSVWLRTNESVAPANPYLVLLWSRNLEEIITYVNLEGDEYNTTHYDSPGYGIISLNPSTGSLELQNLTLRDAGIYHLDMVQNVTGYHGEVTLLVYETISNASIIPSSTVVIADKNFKNLSLNLTCEAQGNISSIEWTKDGQNISLGSRISLHQNNRTLMISPVERADDGQYQCHLSNPVGNKTADYTLAVSYGPVNVAISGPTEIDASDNATFICTAESYPPAHFSWTFDGVDKGITGSEYKLNNSKVGDSGNYTCTASNPNTHTKICATRMLIVNGGLSSISDGNLTGITLSIAMMIFLIC